MNLVELDEKDLQIIRSLLQDSRKSFSDLSAELGVPRTTLQERVKRLVDRGVIKSFTIIPDYSKLGRPVTAFVLVSFMPGSGYSQREVAGRIAEIEGVHEVHIVSGDWDILVKIRGASMEEIGSIVIDKIRGIEGVARTLTCASFATIKEMP